MMALSMGCVPVMHSLFGEMTENLGFVVRETIQIKNSKHTEDIMSPLEIQWCMVIENMEIFI